MARHAAQDGDGRGALADGAPEVAQQGRQVAAGHRVGQVVQRPLGAVADHGGGIGQRHAGPLADIEHQLVELAAGQGAVAAQVGQQIAQRRRVGGQPGRRQMLRHHLAQRVALVAVAGHGGAGLGRLEGLAQAARAEVAGLDDHQRVARRVGEEALEELGSRVGGVADPHHPAPAAEGDGGGLVVQPRRIVLQLAGGELGDAEGIVGRRDRGGQPGGALAHQPAVGPIEQHGADRPGRRLAEAVGIARRHLHAGRSPCAPAGRG